MKIKPLIEKELIRNLNAREDFKEKLASLPEGSLRADIRGDKVYYSRRINGKSYYIKIGSARLVEQLKERKFVETGLEIVERNIVHLQALLDNYQTFLTGDILARMPKSYRSEAEMRGVFNGRYINAGDWEKADYPKRDWNPEYKKPGHVTLKGEAVRSKSELSIANILHAKGIRYRYEEEIEIGGILFCPDFIVYVESEDRYLLLEHCGLMLDESYQRRYARKVARYIMGGLMPGRDVFFTYDDKDGNLDTRLINEILELYFM